MYNYDLMVESEAIDNLYTMYVLESDDVSETKNNARKIGILQRLANFFKKMIDKVKSFFTGKKKDKIDGLDRLNIKGEDGQADAAIKRMEKFAAKDDVTDRDIEQAKEDLETIKELPKKQDSLFQRYKEEFKSGKGIAKFAIVSTANVWNVVRFIKNKKINEKMSHSCDKIIESAKAGRPIDDKDIKKCMRSRWKSTILLGTLDTISALGSQIQFHNSVIDNWTKDKISNVNKTAGKVYGGLRDVKRGLDAFGNSTHFISNTYTNVINNMNVKKNIKEINKELANSDPIGSDAWEIVDESVYDKILNDIDLI